MPFADRIRQRLALTLAALLALQLAAIAIIWLIAGSSLEAEQRAALLGAFVFMLLLADGAAVKYVFDAYLLPLVRLREEVTLLAANPAHRMTPHGGREVRSLVGKLNDLAADHQALREKGAESVAQAGRALAEEKNRLATLMAELAVGVVACNLEGRILLFNKHALQLLESGGGRAPDNNVAMIGLGRSLFGVIDRELIVHALEKMQHRLNGSSVTGEGVRAASAREVTSASSNFVAALAGGQFMRVRMAPVMDDAARLNGFLLVMEDITQEVEVDSRRDALLMALTQDARAALANLRAAVETLQTFPDMESGRRQRFFTVIEEESQRLSRQIDRAQQEHGAVVERRHGFEEMRAVDFLALLQRRIASPELVIKLASGANNGGESGGESGGDIRADRGEPWVALDAYSLTQGLAHWCRRLVDREGVHKAELRAERSGGLVRIEFSWKGAGPGADVLREWEQMPLPAHAAKEGESLAAVLARHGGESVYRFEPASGRSHYFLLLPASTAPAALEILPRVPERPEFYDFDLFQHVGRNAELESMPLVQLGYTVFDTETTGLQPAAGDEIISIGAVRIVNARLLRHEYFESLIRPRCPLSDESVKIHGISEAMLANQPRSEQVLPQFQRFVEDTVLVAHNAAFDLRFLQMQEGQTGVRLRQPVLDTLLLSQVIHPHQAEHTLEAIAVRLGVAIVGRHTALGDAIVTAEIFLRMLPLLAEQGIRTLGQAIEAAQQTRYARLRY